MNKDELLRSRVDIDSITNYIKEYIEKIRVIYPSVSLYTTYTIGNFFLVSVKAHTREYMKNYIKYNLDIVIKSKNMDEELGISNLITNSMHKDLERTLMDVFLFDGPVIFKGLNLIYNNDDVGIKYQPCFDHIYIQLAIGRK